MDPQNKTSQRPTPPRRTERKSQTVETSVMGGLQVGDNNITNITHIYNNCKQCHPTEEHDSSQDASRDLRSTSTVHTAASVRRVDREGKELELGNWVFTDNDKVLSIYAGDGMIIMQDRKTRKIVKEPISVEENFISFPCLWGIKYSGRQVIGRAMAVVGRVFDGHNLDFARWCCCDMTLTEMKHTNARLGLA